MNKTFDLNKASKAHKARKAWKQIHEEKGLNKFDSKSTQDAAERAVASEAALRKSSKKFASCQCGYSEQGGHSIR